DNPQPAAAVQALAQIGAHPAARRQALLFQLYSPGLQQPLGRDRPGSGSSDYRPGSAGCRLGSEEVRRPEAGREMTAAESAGCACKGIRACKICCAAKQLPLVAVSAASSLPQPDQPPLHFCIDCQAVRATPRHADGDDAEHWSAIPSSASGLAGIRVFRDFINPDEEAVLAAEIDKRPWAPSQSGRRKQDYGPKVNFKRRRLNTASFKGLPPYWSALLPRLLALPGLADFQPVELCNLDYQPELGAHIDPHIDDTWLWGDRLVTLNLCSDTSLTLSNRPAPRASASPCQTQRVLVLSGPARYDWLHAVLPDDVTGRRIGCDA
ncbi:hypothetical protein BOX15_Mlig008241g2, partial [Macrostomum lignano]